MKPPGSDRPRHEAPAAASGGGAAAGSGGGRSGPHQPEAGPAAGGGSVAEPPAARGSPAAPGAAAPAAAFAVLQVEAFALQAILRTSAELAGQPVALLASERKRATIVALTPAARAAGVEPGLTAPQAQARCATLRVLTPQPAVEAEARAALLAAAFTLSPLVEATAPGVATAEVTALPAERREPALRQALAQLDALGLAATGGLAATPLLALYAARAAGHRGSPPPRLPQSKGDPRARMAETQKHPSPDRAASLQPDEDVGAPGRPSVAPAGEAEGVQPDEEVGGPRPPLNVSGQPPAAGVEPTRRGRRGPSLGSRDGTCSGGDAAGSASTFTLHGGCGQAHRDLPRVDEARVRVVTDARGFLAPLPLAVAEPPEDLAPILGSWGLRTLGDLVALPKADIVQRLGPAGLALWERAAGETTRPLDPVAPPRAFAAAVELEEAIETLEPLLFLLRRFLDRLTLELRGAGLVAAALQLTLPLDDGQEHARTFRLPEPTADAEILFRALHAHLETVHTASAVVGVRLTLEPARPLARQHGLFDTGLRDPHGFAETLARTVAVIGSGRVGTPRCEDTHRPDAITLVPPAPVIPPAAPADPLSPLGFALRRFRPPLPARIELNASAAAPTYVWTERLQGSVTRTRGPWRGSGGWWQRDAAWEREEWDVVLSNGGLYRVVRTPEGWWLEGEYD